MSIFARSRRMTDVATFWTLGSSTGRYNTASYSTPVTVVCNYHSGGNMQQDSEGTQFQPASTYYVIGDKGIKKGDRIVRGSVTNAEPTSDAETVRKIVTKTPMRGEQMFTIYTG